MESKRLGDGSVRISFTGECEGEGALQILFDDRDILLAESAGNFWLAQYLCSRVCATQGVSETQDELRILTFDLLGIRQRLMTDLSQRYLYYAHFRQRQEIAALAATNLT